MLESGDEQNPKFGAKNYIYIYTIFFNVGEIVRLVKIENIEIILVVVYIMTEWMFVAKIYELWNKKKSSLNVNNNNNNNNVIKMKELEFMIHKHINVWSFFRRLNDSKNSWENECIEAFLHKKLPNLLKCTFIL